MFKKYAVMSMFVALLFVFLAFSPGAWGANASMDYAPGDLIVVFRNPNASQGVTAEAVKNGAYNDYLTSVAKSEGFTVGKTFDALSQSGNGIFAIIHTEKGLEKKTAENLKARPDVIGVQLNYKYTLYDSVTPNDTKYGSLWGMPPIKAPEAWSISTGADNVYAAVIDSGIDYTHADIANNFETNGYSGNYSIGTPEGDYSDENGHGTHVAGTIAAVGNNGLGVVGVNWNAKLISLRIFDSSGSCWTQEIIDALNALLTLLNNDPGLKIASVNMSYGRSSWDDPSTQYGTPEYLAYKAVDDTNRIVMCMAAGNSYSEVGNGYYHYPALFPDLNNKIAVAAADNTPDYSRADYSCWSTEFVDIAAPGTDILSTAPQESTLNDMYPWQVEEENGYKYLTISGTSMATPHVAGAVALLAAAYPDADASALKSAIIEGANADYATDYTVNGFLDVEGAMNILADEFGGNTPPEITTSSLPDAGRMVAYSVTLSARGTRPITWSITAGALPEGLSLESNGRISGTPSALGTSTFTITAANDFGSYSAEFSITVDEHPDTPLIAINSENFPDDNFRNYVSSNFDSNRDSYLSKNEMWNVTSISVDGMNISSLKGIEYFTKLLELYCSNNQITEIDLASNTDLKRLYCYSNQLTALDVTNNTALTSLSCYSNQLTALDVTNNTALASLSCSSNQLTALDVTNNTALTYLSCYYNQIAAIDVSNNTNLTHLDIDGNQLSEINVRKNTELRTLWVCNNPLTELDIRRNTDLRYLYAYSCQFTELDVTNNTALTYLSCSSNQLAKLDVSANTMLNTLHFSNNRLAWIDLSNNPAIDSFSGSSQYIYDLGLYESYNSDYPYMYSLSNLIPSYKLSNVDQYSIYAYDSSGWSVSCNYDSDGTIYFASQPSYMQYNYETEYGQIDVRLYFSDTPVQSSPAIVSDVIQGLPGQSFSGQLNANGVQPITWEIIDGTLPATLTISSSGEISGTMPDEGVYHITVRASNSAGSSEKRIAIVSGSGQKPVILSDSLPNAVAGQPYSAAITASGNTPITWSLTEGTLPAGLSMSSANDTAIISGTPEETGTFVITVTAENEILASSKEFVLKVSGMHDAPPDHHSMKIDYFADAQLAAGKSSYISAKLNNIGISLSGVYVPSESFTRLKNGRIVRQDSRKTSALSETERLYDAFTIGWGWGSYRYGKNGYVESYTSKTFDLIGDQNKWYYYVADPDDFSGEPVYFWDGADEAFSGRDFSWTVPDYSTAYAYPSIRSVSTQLYTAVPYVEFGGMNEEGKYTSLEWRFVNANDTSSPVQTLLDGKLSIEVNTIDSEGTEKSYSVLYDYSVSSDQIAFGTAQFSSPVDPEEISGVFASFSTKDVNYIWCFSIMTPPSITTETLSDATKNEEYYGIIEAEGSLPMTWEITEGNFPGGIYYYDSGDVLVIEGTPYEKGTFAFTLKVSNAAGESSRSFTLEVLSDGISEADYKLNLDSLTISSFRNGKTLYDVPENEVYTGSADIMLYLEEDYADEEDTMYSSASSSVQKGRKHFRHIDRIKSRKAAKSRTSAEDSDGDFISGAFTIGAGSGWYKLRSGEEIGYWDVVLGLVSDDGIFTVAENSDETLSFMGGADYAFKYRTFYWGFYDSINEYVSGSTSLGNLRSVSDQMNTSVPYVELTTPDENGRYTRAEWRLVSTNDTSAKTAPGFDSVLSIRVNDEYIVIDEEIGADELAGGEATLSQPLALKDVYDIRAELIQGSMIYEWLFETLAYPPEIITAEIPQGSLNEFYDFTISVSGDQPITWSITNNLPAGMSFDASSGRIYGTPTAYGTYGLTLTAANTAGEASASFTLNIAGIAPVITSDEIRDVYNNKPYSQTLTAEGSKYIYWEIVSGALPNGLALDGSTGTISGTPTRNGKFSVTIRAYNSVGTDEKSYIINVGKGPEIKKLKLNDATAGKKYSGTITHIATKPKKFSVISSALPGGLELSESTGKISGTPTESGTFVFRVRLEDKIGSVECDITLTVNAVKPVIKTPKFPKGQAGEYYEYTLDLSKGTTPVTWSVTGLPSGLSYDADTGTISGIPDEAFNKNITVTASNSAGTSSAKKPKLTIKGFKPAILDTSLADGVKGSEYYYQLSAKGSPVLKWSWSGKKPSGLKINAKTGEISGTPKKAGTYEVIITVKNSVDKDRRTFTITVADGNTDLPASNTGASESTGTTEEYTSGTQSGYQGMTSLQPDEEDMTLTVSGQDYIVAAVLPEVSVDVAGQYDFGVELGEYVPVGAKLFWFAFPDGESSEDDEIADFYDDNGEEIDSVPESRLITVSPWLNPGIVYRPVIGAKAK